MIAPTLILRSFLGSAFGGDKPGTSMAYGQGWKKRLRRTDPETGLAISRLRSLADFYEQSLLEGRDRSSHRYAKAEPLYHSYLFGEDSSNTGGFDLDAWALNNDATCLTENGGLSNPTSMAALGHISKNTFVAKVIPHLFEVGSLYILSPRGPYVAGRDAIIVAITEVTERSIAAQRDAGRRNLGNLISRRASIFRRAADVSGGSAYYAADASVALIASA